MLPAAAAPLAAGTATFPPAELGHYGCWAVVAIGCMTIAEKNLHNRASPVENRQTARRALEMHPFWCCATLLLKGSMSLDFRVATLPYKSSSFATPEGEVLVALCLEVLMRLKAERRANLPHRHCYLDKRIHLNTCQKRHVFFSALKN